MAWFVTARHDLLPTLLSEGRYTSTMIGVVSAVWCFSLGALFVLLFRRPHSVLDVWLMVVLCAWLFDIALSAILNVAQIRSRFLRRADLRAVRRKLRSGRVADRQCRPAGPVIATVRGVAQPSRLRTRSPYRARAPVQRRCRIPPTMPSLPRRSTASSPAGTRPRSACLAIRRPRRWDSVSTSSSPGNAGRR